VAGLTVFTVADVVYAFRVSTNGYELGTPLDAMWSVGLTLVSTWAVRQAFGPRVRREAPPLRTAAPLIVPALANVAALAVLLAAGRGLVSQPAVALAVLTGLVAAGRTHVAYRELSRMPELTRLSRTDDRSRPRAWCRRPAWPIGAPSTTTPVDG
jgi:hypothetical protein